MKLTKSYNKVKLLLVGQGFENDPENTEAELRIFVDKNGLKRKGFILRLQGGYPRFTKYYGHLLPDLF